ncbi:MAG: ferrous iron transport protein B [Bacteroidetes bacterium]|nr:ferrous iron transport protein B [Bacteroidota bacterium]MBU1423473.1 ferrous iron transport protein B [Bacteroidota bacterium]MBU2636413.1 ferrous iron transport protein B [Bacteroidota bacterium]
MNEKKKLNIVLAGQANVGKSVIFNYLTGLHQHIGNWPGKTIEKAEGTLFYKGYTIDVVDLPGIYSLTTYSIEESISREYIASQKPDFAVNVVDAVHLERNLLFTLQLLELGRPTVLALNMINLLKERGIEINFKILEKILGVPVVPIAAIYRKGITDVLDRGIELLNFQSPTPQNRLKYGKEVEQAIEILVEALEGINTPYTKRWLALKLLERDGEIEKLIREKNSELLKNVENLRTQLEKIHGHDSSIVIADERCHLAFQIIKEVMKITPLKKISLQERFDAVTAHKIWGYFTMTAIMASMFLVIFKFGDWLSGLLEIIFANLQSWFETISGISVLASLFLAVLKSVLALIQIALPYILPFYLILFLLEDWGYLARVAFLMDNLMHKLGTHGKASIPLLLGFGCNVPACLSCRIMETERERFLTGILTVFVPCSAASVIIMGLVGKFVGMYWAFALYVFAILIIFVIGKLASKILPGEATELIMEMPDYKRPSLRTIILQTWFRLKEFIYIAGPLVIISGIIIEGIYWAGWFPFIDNLLSPISVKWLGLPAITGILLIFGILRKELILVMLSTTLGTANFAQVLSPIQMLTLAIVSMLYIPCIATIAALRKEFGWKKTLGVTVFKIFFAIAVAGSISKILSIFL